MIEIPILSWKSPPARYYRKHSEEEHRARAANGGAGSKVHRTHFIKCVEDLRRRLVNRTQHGAPFVGQLPQQLDNPEPAFSRAN
jgi:hypothetical protein